MNQHEPAGNEDLELPDELATLKSRADILGIKYHPSISVEKLREKVVAAMADTPDSVLADVESEAAIRFRKRREANELIRIRVACMNPDKKEWPGEFFTVGNSLVGSFTKFVPFESDDGYHVPRIIYNQLIERKCQIFVTVVDARGNKVKKGKLIREFNIEVMPALTAEEMTELARRQALSHAID